MPTYRLSKPNAGFHLWGMRWIGIGVLLLTLFSTFAGCSGCKPEDPVAKAQREQEEKDKADADKKRKEQEKPKPDFEMVAVEVFPTPLYKLTTDNPDDKARKETQKEPRLKVGHWGTGLSYWRVNNFDFSGRLQATSTDSRTPFDIERTNFRLSTSRPAVLTKGLQTKALETSFFVPRRSEDGGMLTFFQLEMLAGRNGGSRDLRGFLTRAVAAHEYFFVVLTSADGKYEFLRKNDDTFPSMCMRDENDLDGSLRMYHVQTPSIKGRIPLSEHSLAWTSIAYVLLDDVDPALFSTGQQTAMIDWLHWGGQILVSGPQTLDRLKGSFLEPYLPASAGPSSKIDTAALAEINEYWSLPSIKNATRDQPNILVVADKPMVGVSLVKAAEADFVPKTGELVAERRIGQGRIVVTGFPLADFRIQNWRNYDGFFNGCLLRRPSREFVAPDYSTPQGVANNSGLGPTFRWKVRPATDEKPDRELVREPEDPRIISSLRYFSRDSGQLSGKVQALPPPPVLSTKQAKDIADAAERGRPWWEYKPTEEATNFPDWHFAGSEGADASGVAGWNDFSGAANAARDTLREAAGIRIPTGLFVMQVLGIYLLVLVPLNWFIFWLIGRVEWAWACAPLIAILGAFAVIRLAQLDIGFAYSRTEVAILETQGSYSRGHLTRFTTLYTSLSSSYNLDFEDPSAQALPFSTDPKFERAIGRAAQTCQFDREKQVSLSNIQVPSNSTGTVRSEHMVDVGSGLVLAGNEATGFSVKNGSELLLKDVGILRRQKETGKMQVAYIKELRAGVSQEIDFEPSNQELIIDGWQQSPIMSTDLEQPADPGTIRLGRLVRVASEQMKLLPGDIRLVAWTDDEIPGMTIYPTAPQNQVRTLILAHLVHGQLPAPQRDRNVYRDIRPEREILDGSDFGTTPTSLKTEQGLIKP